MTKENANLSDMETPCLSRKPIVKDRPPIISGLKLHCLCGLSLLVR